MFNVQAHVSLLLYIYRFTSELGNIKSLLRIGLLVSSNLLNTLSTSILILLLQGFNNKYLSNILAIFNYRVTLFMSKKFKYTPVKTTSSAILLASTLSISHLALAHSSMFLDFYEFDETEGGQGVEVEFKNNGAITQCQNGFAGDYPCKNVDLMSFVKSENLGGGSSSLNDIWGWTAPDTGQEIAIVGKANGTSFVDVSDPLNPITIGFLPSHTGSSSWRDMKVYNDHAYIVSDSNGNHGLQIFNLNTLQSTTPGSTLTASNHHDGFGSAHNMIINEDSGYGYVVGSNRCGGGLYMLDLSEPASPSYAGCFSSDGYTHDAQCVVYSGPDSRYFGNEICIAYNEDTVTVVDVSDKSNPIQLSKLGYQGSSYTHQGWFLNDDHSIIIANDELDEQDNQHNTRSYIFDLSNLENPRLIGQYDGPTQAIDHNLYTKDSYVYESNYRAGLRILSTENINAGEMQEAAFFDTIPNSSSAQFSGLWSSYIYFESGIVISSDIGNGLFILKPQLNNTSGNPPQPSTSPQASPTPLATPVATRSPIPTTAPSPSPTLAPTPSMTPSPQPSANPEGFECSPDAVNFHNLAFSSYANQDQNGGIEILDDGCTLKMTGNTWKFSSLNYLLTTDTLFEFDFKVETEGEIQGFALSNGMPQAIDPSKTYNLAGTFNWAIEDFKYNNSGNYQHLSIPLGLYYAGNDVNISFVNDDDENSEAVLYFRNLRIIN